MLYYYIVLSWGAKGLDGGYEAQVACRGSVTTKKGGNTYKSQQRTGTRCIINAAHYLEIACVSRIVSDSRLALRDFF
jgi:hypothetical protein